MGNAFSLLTQLPRNKERIDLIFENPTSGGEPVSILYYEHRLHKYSFQYNYQPAKTHTIFFSRLLYALLSITVAADKQGIPGWKQLGRQ